MQGKKSFGTSGHSTHIQTAWGLSGWTLRSATRHTLLQTTKLNSAQTKFILSHIEKLLFKWTRLSLKPLGLQSRLLLWIFMTWTIKESYFQSILGLQAYPEELLPASEWCSWLGEESQANIPDCTHGSVSHAGHSLELSCSCRGTVHSLLRLSFHSIFSAIAK